MEEVAGLRRKTVATVVELLMAYEHEIKCEDPRGSIEFVIGCAADLLDVWARERPEKFEARDVVDRLSRLVRAYLTAPS